MLESTKKSENIRNNFNKNFSWKKSQNVADPTERDPGYEHI